MTNIRGLVHQITERYLEESTQRPDAAERAALARKLLDKSGSAETLEQFYSDPLTVLAAEFLETAGADTSFGALAAFMERKFKEKGGSD